MTWIYFVVTCLISVVVAQNEEITLPANITLPPDLQQQFESPEVKEVQTKYMEEFRKKCDKNGHPEVYENIKTAFQTFMSCSSALVDKDVLEAEIEEAKPDGKVDEVFKKYCDRTPQFKACFRNMTETIKPCFSAAEQKNFKTMYNVTDQLTEFICYKDGDRIALFIAEGGKECFEDKQEALQACFNQTFDSQTQGNLKNMTMDGVFDLEFKEEECNKMTKFQTCVVSVLETCNKPTSANIVDSLFNFVRGATPCKDFSKAEKRNKPNSASSFAVTTGTVLMALTAAMLV